MTIKTLLAAALMGASLTCLADTWPSKPITLSIGFSAGASDTMARIIAEKMSKVLGQPILIDNRPGAGSTLAPEFVARAAPDGYTLLMTGNNIYGADQTLYKSAKYDGAKSFTPITRWVSSALVLAVNKDSKINSVQDLITEAKRNPDKLAYSSSGAGVVTHLAAIQFEQAAGVSMLHVPYKGGGPSLLALAAGDVQLTFGTPPSVLQMVQNGRVKMLAVTAPSRSRLLPDVPTLSESGLKGFDLTFWYGLFAPAGLPSEIAQKLFDASIVALNDPDVRARLDKTGSEVAPSKSMTEFRDFAVVDGKRARELTLRSGVKIE